MRPKLKEKHQSLGGRGGGGGKGVAAPGGMRLDENMNALLYYLIGLQKRLQIGWLSRKPKRF